MTGDLDRLYEREAYGEEADRGNYWRTTTGASRDWPSLTGTAKAEIGIVGAGFTGLSAALHLAKAGCDVAVLDAEAPGWGASGRNGGFVCLGGAKASDAQIRRQYGVEALREFRLAQRSAIDTVAELLDDHAIEADRHSDGEVVLAHRASDVSGLRREASDLAAFHGVAPRLIAGADLAAEGFAGKGFYGALHLPIGFALNPRKYALGLARAAEAAGARLFGRSPVTAIRNEAGGYRLISREGDLFCKQLVLATNGYSSDNLPDRFRGRFLPVQSSILVTRKLTQDELRIGWNSGLMAYDTRNLLHYFRLLPEGRFLFGMRGGIRADAAALERVRRAVRADFDAMFPMWAAVETPHFWSGLACLARNLTPYLGPIEGMDGAYTAMAFHGNGVAMASHSGKLLAGMITGGGSRVPKVMQGPFRRFPLGRWRRGLLHPAYGWYRLKDR